MPVLSKQKVSISKIIKIIFNPLALHGTPVRLRHGALTVTENFIEGTEIMGTETKTRIYLNATWFVEAGKGYRGMVEVCRPNMGPESITCEFVRDDISAAQADAEALKADIKSLS